MSASSSEVVVGFRTKQALKRISKPWWLLPFLNKTFFDKCTTHPFRRNELNKYCTNCNQSVCHHCVSSSSHQDHEILQIYKHVYKDVVTLAAMEQYIDCSLIQPFRCNKRPVIFLSPLPHCGSGKNNGPPCDTCSRKLIEPDLYRYCSISCKVTAFLNKAKDSDPPFISIQAPPPPPPPPPQEPAKPPKPASRRKGIPHRAPFF